MSIQHHYHQFPFHLQLGVLNVNCSATIRICLLLKCFISPLLTFLILPSFSNEEDCEQIRVISAGSLFIFSSGRLVVSSDLQLPSHVPIHAFHVQCLQPPMCYRSSNVSFELFSVHHWKDCRFPTCLTAYRGWFQRLLCLFFIPFLLHPSPILEAYIPVSL